MKTADEVIVGVFVFVAAVLLFIGGYILRTVIQRPSIVYLNNGHIIIDVESDPWNADKIIVQGPNGEYREFYGQQKIEPEAEQDVYTPDKAIEKEYWPSDDGSI